MNETITRKPFVTTAGLTLAGVMTALTCVASPFSIPIPISPVPITLQMLVLLLSSVLLGMKLSTISCGVYLLLGFCGIPVFAGFKGGFGVLAGPTGGYLAGFLLLTLISGFFADRFPKNRPLLLPGMVLGTAATYLVGTAWLAHQLDMTFRGALAVGVIPYLPTDAIKIIIVLLIAPEIRKRTAPILHKEK